MEAFLLHHDSAGLDDPMLRAAFDARGLKDMQSIRLGAYRIHWTSKDLCPPSTLLRAKDRQGHQRCLFLFGTLCYRGLGVEEGRCRFLQDLLADELRVGELVGAFAALLFDETHPGAPRLLCDAAGVFRLYQDGEGQILSSSQVLVLLASDRTWDLDRGACLELLTTGFLVSPRTLFRGLRLVSSRFPPKGGMVVHQEPKVAEEPKGPGNSFVQHVDYQLERLRDYMRICSGVLHEQGMDMGLSGGFDSRLILLLARETGCPLTTHTHVKEGENSDQQVAQRIQQALGLQLHEIATRKPLEMELAELEQVLESAWRMYDGQSVRMMDISRHEYTAPYRQQAMGAMGLHLSGVGGELYRNYNFTAPWGGMERDSWAAYYVINVLILSALEGDTVRRQLVSDKRRRILRALGQPELRRIDFTTARRFYGEIWLGHWHSVRNCAENSVSHYLAPFSDAGIVRAALQSTRWIGLHGRFEAAMIERLDPAVAALPSSYGFPFTRISPSYKLHASMRALVPNQLKLAAGRWQARSRSMPLRDPPLLGRGPIRDALAAVRELQLPLDWRRFLADGSSAILAFTLGYNLQRLTSRLRVDTRGACLSEGNDDE